MNGPDACEGIWVPVDVDFVQRLRTQVASSLGENQGKGPRTLGSLACSSRTLAGRGDLRATEPGQAGSKPGTGSKILFGILWRGQGTAGHGRCRGGLQVQTGSRPRLSAAVGGDTEAEQTRLGPALQLVRCRASPREAGAEGTLIIKEAAGQMLRRSRRPSSEAWGEGSPS